jgi:hypothetical protein
MEFIESNGKTKVRLPRHLILPLPQHKVDGIHFVENEDLLEYFDLVFSETSDALQVNGHIECRCCTYCDFYTNYADKTDVRYRCYDCHADMCFNCSIKDEEIAKTCKTSHDFCSVDRKLLDTVSALNHNYFTCDKCDNNLDVSKPFYADRTWGGYTYHEQCHVDGLKGRDTLVLTEVNDTEVERNNHFGNVMDWRPLYVEYYEDDEKSHPTYILQCLNPKNSFNKRFAFLSADHKYFKGVNTCSADTTLQGLLQEYKSIKATKADKVYPRMGFERLFDTPFRNMMGIRNMQFYFA